MIRAGIAVALALFAVVTAARGAELLAERGAEVAVGRNLSGEECRLRFVFEQKEPIELRRYALYCQGWSQPSGELRRFRSSSNFQALAAIGDASPFGKAMDGRLTQCLPVQATRLADGSTAGYRACRAANGGWPIVLTVASVSGYSYYAESLPTNQPVMEAAALVLAGKQQPAAQPPRTAAIQALEAALGTSATQFGVQDIGAIEDLKTLTVQYIYRRDYEQAEATGRRALEIIERVFGAGAWAAGDPLTHIGLAQSSLGRLADAAESFKRAEPLVRASPDARDLRRYLSFTANLLRERGDAAGAVKRAQEAVALARERKMHPRSLGNALMFEAEALQSARRHAEAASVGEQAVTELARGYGPYHPEIGTTWDWVSFARSDAGEHAKAREAAQKALELRQVLYGSGVPVAESWYAVGRTHRVERNLAASLDAYRRGTQALEADRFGRGGLNVIRITGYFEAVLEAARAEPSRATALWREAVKASQVVRGGDVTSSAIRQMAARVNADDPAVGQLAKQLQDRQDRLSRLRADLAREGRRQSEERDTTFEEQVKAEIRTVAAEAEAAERQVQGQFPRYAGLVGRALVGGEEIAGLLKPEDAVLTLLVAPAATYAVVLRPQSAAGHRVAVSTAELTDLVARIRASTDWTERQDKPFDLAAARKLYDLLLKPIESALAGAQRLVIVPAGPLQSLPFGLLVAGGQGDDLRQQDWLAKRFAIATVPSLTAYRDLRQVRAVKPAAQPFIGFGDPDFAGTQANTQGSLRNLQKLTTTCRRGQIELAELRDLPRLAESAEEVKRIAQSLKAGPGAVVLGPQATEAAVKGAKLADYRVVMFATHGVLPTEIACLPEPALALTPPKSGSGRDDGLLRASEVVGLKLNADFVVLSACNTASADGRLSGEALSGLARAFFYAGARAVLASHWAVASEPTVTLTTAAFAAYAKEPNAGRAAALQKAQLAMLGNAATAHPVFWAPFVLVGDGT